MIRLYIAGGVLLAFLSLGGMYAWQSSQLKAERAKVERLEAEKDALEASAKAEVQIQTVTRTVYRTVEKVKHEVSAIDPQCTNDGALVAAWDRGIDRVRQAAAEPDRSPAIDPATVPQP